MTRMFGTVTVTSIDFLCLVVLALLLTYPDVHHLNPVFSGRLSSSIVVSSLPDPFPFPSPSFHLFPLVLFTPLSSFSLSFWIFLVLSQVPMCFCQVCMYLCVGLCGNTSDGWPGFCFYEEKSNRMYIHCSFCCVFLLQELSKLLTLRATWMEKKHRWAESLLIYQAVLMRKF